MRVGESADGLLAALAAGRPDRVRHVAAQPARAGEPVDWPAWLPAEVVAACANRGIGRPWSHQVAAADLAHAGGHVVVATGTASGKSLAYQLPAFAAIHEGQSAPDARGATVLYLAPTKALAHDQLRALDAFGLPWLRACTVDGDASPAERDWAKAHANLVLTNPDFVHHAMLGGHRSWSAFLRRLRFIVVDECHAYRGVFGTHVALVLRRLRRAAGRYGAVPVVIAASATIAEPEVLLGNLIGDAVAAVTDDGSPHPARTVALWEPGETGFEDELGQPVRRTATAEAAELMADAVVSGGQCLAFVRSRRAAESVAIAARGHLAEIEPGLAAGVASYRAGYLPEERRELEAALRDGRIRAMAATNALELGIDISGLDTVLIAGWPGTRASLWQQVGRAGRGDEPALSVFIARDDPLDMFIVRHPEMVFGRPVEASVFDPANRYVLPAHLCAAASEFPLTPDDAVRWFGPTAPGLADQLVADGLLRRRPTGWFWTHPERASDLADLRSAGGPPVRIVEEGTGRILGTMDQAAAHANLHPGAVYTHQGVTHVVTSLDLVDAVATVVEERTDIVTEARELSDIVIVEEREHTSWGAAQLCLGTVRVSSQVLAYAKRRAQTREYLGTEPLDLPPRELETTAVWWTVTDDMLAAAGLSETELAGAAHAAEHASIGLLPLFATCDRWDIGGVSTPLHADTGQLTVFVYDGYPGGAGFAEHGYRTAATWLADTRALIAECPCERGCPACVQSPKCGNGNEPLDKSGAIRLLDVLLAGTGAALQD